MIKKGTLNCGFAYEVDDEVLDDMYLVEAVAEAQGEDPLKITKVITMVLGPEQKARLYKHLENEKHRVPAEVAVTTLQELFEKLGDEGKN
jgi:hypothetical protein